MLAPGTRIGPRYTIDRLLGQGGMSNLYLARDAQQGGAVRVIKEMTARYPDPNEQRMAEQLFMREAQLLSTLNHPNIPKVFDKFTFQGKYYLSMEYVQGEDLGKIIQDAGRPLDEKDVANWGHQMATVLYYLHRQNPPIVFRDVKPSNMMIAGDQVKLIDFGIARVFTPAKKGDTMRIGSPGYAPPEQYNGQTDPRSDIYALGVTLHHALTGHDPTASQTPFLYPPIKSLNPRVSDDMVRIIEKAIQLDPDKRYSSCIDMKRDLQVVLRSHGILVGASTPLQPLVASPSATTIATQPSAPTVTNASAPVPVATPVVPTPSPTPALTPAPPPQPINKTISPPARKRSWGKLAALALLLAGGTATAAVAPQIAQRIPPAWKESAQAMLSPNLPADPNVAAPLLYRRGGPLPLVLELTQRALEQRPGDAELLILQQNALVLQSSAPSQRWTVLVPDNPARGDMMRGLALAQGLLNQRGSSDQGSLALEVVAYDPAQFTSVYRDSLQGRWSRPTGPGGSSAPQTVLVFADKEFAWTELLAGSSVPTYVVGPLSGAVPSGLRFLNLPESSPGDAAKRIFSGDLSKIIWLAAKAKAPEGVTAAPGAPEAKLLSLLKGKSGQRIVVEPDQLKSLNAAKLPSEAKLCVLADRFDQLPAPADVANLKSVQALVAGSRFSAAPLQSAFFARGSRLLSDWKPQPRSPGGTSYDGLLWAAQPSGTRWTGVNLKVDSEGKIGPAPWQVFELQDQHWTLVREEEWR